MGYFLFQLVTVMLFVRPAEIFPAVQEWFSYEYAILICLAVSLPGILRQLSPKSLADNPVTACVIGVWAAVVMSHLAHLNIYGARMSGFMFFKIVAYYLLLVTNVNSERRIKRFLCLLLVLITFVAAIGLLAAYHVVELPGVDFYQQREYDEESGEMMVIPRLCSTGVFNDPNDLAMILVAGAVIAVYFITNRDATVLRLLGVPLVFFFGYAIYATQSRGGLLAAIAALLALFYARWGWKRTVLLGVIAIPLLFVVFKGRMTTLDSGMDGGTGQARVRGWLEAIGFFRQDPIFGIGVGELAEQTGFVAHNSFVQGYAELGFVGGTMFFGIFAYALASLFRLRNLKRVDDSDVAHIKCLEQCEQPEDSGDAMRHRSILPEHDNWLQHLLPFLIAIVIGFAASMFSITRNYVVSPYLVIGLVAATASVVSRRASYPILRIDSRSIQRLACASACFVVAIYLFSRFTARWS